MTKGGYWYPHLKHSRCDSDTPWSPRFRNPDGSEGETLRLEFESAGAVMAYLKRAGLAAWDGRTDRPVSFPKCRHLQTPDRCAVCTAPDDPDHDRLFADQNPEPDRPDGMPDDPRFEWVSITNFSDANPRWIKGRCNHLTPAPVDLRTGELVAWWCPDCGEQFEWDRWPVPDHLWVPLPEVDRSRIMGVSMVVPEGAELSVFEQRYREMVGKDSPNVVITYQNPRMDDNGDLIPWTRWAYDTMFVPVWNGIKSSVGYMWPIWLVVINYVILMITGQI